MKNRSVITDEQVEKRYEALPDDVAEAFESAETSRLLFEIGKKQGLAIDKIGELAREVGYLMLGFVAAGEFIPDLAEIIGDQEKAKAAAQEINQKILLPIRESLKKTYGGQWPEEEKIAKPAIPKPAPPPSPAHAPAAPPPKATAGEARKPELIIIAPLAAKPKEEKPLAPLPKPEEPKPAQVLRGKTWAGEPVKPPPTGPQPLIIYPLPKKDFNGITANAKIGQKEIMPQASQEPKPLPVVPPEPTAAYETVKEAVKKELAKFQNDKTAKETGVAKTAKEIETPPRPATPPSPYVITKEELQKEIERFRQSAADSGKRIADSVTHPPAAPTPTPAPPTPKPIESKSPAPLKLPQQKFPKPQAPEKYEIDPYRETTE